MQFVQLQPRTICRYYPEINLGSLKRVTALLSIVSLFCGFVLFQNFYNEPKVWAKQAAEAFFSKTSTTMSSIPSVSASTLRALVSEPSVSTTTKPLKRVGLPGWQQYFIRNFDAKHYSCEDEKYGDSYKPKISVEELEKQLEKSPRSQCNCSDWNYKNKLNATRETYLKSSCGPEATLAREGQNVISYTFFKSKNKTEQPEKYFNLRYFQGISMNIELMKSIYPGWVMRIYTDMNFDGEMCNLVCSDTDIYFCDVRHDDTFLKTDPRIWRFTTLGDPTVAKFVIRDIDSVLNKREREAVAEWENSGYPFHNMRDNPWHGVHMLAGMWGGDNTKLCYQNGMRIIREIMSIPWTEGTITDQTILTEILYYPHQFEILTHDSYLCTYYEDSLPFPRKRPNDYDFVGRTQTLAVLAGVKSKPLDPCPMECRPSYGLDWERC